MWLKLKRGTPRRQFNYWWIEMFRKEKMDCVCLESLAAIK
jgi:hypothetical protein